MDHSLDIAVEADKAAIARESIDDPLRLYIDFDVLWRQLSNLGLSSQAIEDAWMTGVLTMSEDPMA